VRNSIFRTAPFAFLFCASTVISGAVSSPTPPAGNPEAEAISKFYMGADVSSLPELEDHEARYYNADGTSDDPLLILKRHHPTRKIHGGQGVFSNDDDANELLSY